MDILVLIAFFSLFFFTGLFYFKRGLKEKMKYKSCETWKKVNATVLSKEFRKKTDSDSPNIYSVDVSFRYTYLSNAYENNQICFGYSPSSIYEFHYQIYDRIKKANEIEVWINPLNAQESVIVKGIAQSNNFISNFGLVFMLLSCCMFILFILLGTSNDITIIDQIQTLK